MSLLKVSHLALTHPCSGLTIPGTGFSGWVSGQHLLCGHCPHGLHCLQSTCDNNNSITTGNPGHRKALLETDLYSAILF